jgi:hypothetical protein
VASGSGSRGRRGHDRALAITSLRMRVFTALTEAEADQAERGVLRDDAVWVDNPQSHAADADAVWVSIEMPDVRMARFEKDSDPRLSRREFRIPARVTNLHQAQRVKLPL